MAISDRLNKLTTDITNAYTSINNKGGTIPANKNTDNLHTAIDSIQSSNIIGATAEGESLNLANTKAMPYSDYVVEGKSEQEGEPSPSIPSEIHSVADDVNLWNNELDNNVFNDNGIKEYSTIFVMNKVAIDVIPNTSYVVSQKEHPCQQRIIFLNNDTYLSRVNNTVDTTNGHTEFTFVTPENCNKIHIMFRTTVEVISTTGSYVIQPDDITNVKLQKGTVATPYSPYNQGTVTIKQRGKNLGKEEFDQYFNVSGSGQDRTLITSNFKMGQIIRVKPSTNYTITGDFSNLSDGVIRICIFNEYPTIGSTSTNFVYGPSGLNFNTNANTNYIVLYNASQKDTTIPNLFVCETPDSDTYKPYQGYDKVFQTEPLRSLPNGVKDSKESDGNHTRVGVKVFDGSENNWNIETTANYTRFYIKIDDAVINTTERQIIMSNYFKYGTGNLVGTAFIYNQYLFIYPNTDILTIEKLKTWLSTHNAEFIYELKEEIIEPLTQNQATTMLNIIKTGSYEGTTNIYTDEDVKPTMGVDYYKKG